MKIRRARWGAAIAAAGVGIIGALSHGSETTPAQQRVAATQPAGASDMQLADDVVDRCRRTFASIESSLRLVDAARESDEPARSQLMMNQVRRELLNMREQMESCLARVEGTRESAGVALLPAWTCPMHPQMLQDRPGNCSICDMKLIAGAPRESTQALPPAVAGR